MDNNPIYGCRACNTTIGRSGCWEHRDKPGLIIGDIPRCSAEISIRDIRIAALEAELAEARKDGERYRYVRDVAFQYANVSLSGNDDNGTAFVIFEPKLYLPDLPGELKYEEEDWDSNKIDAAIDAARGTK